MKDYPCSCHKCGQKFRSGNPIAITCPSCVSGRKFDLSDLFSAFAHPTEKK